MTYDSTRYIFRVIFRVFWSLQSFDTPLLCLSDHHG